MPLKQPLLILVLAWLLMPLVDSLGYAERVTKVTPDGILEMDTGKKVVLAGLKISPEGLRLLQVLTRGRDVEIDYDPKRPTSSVPAPVYLSIRSHEMKFSRLRQIEHHKVILNEFLLQTGAAAVKTDASFKRKEKFLQIEARARERGEGIWSYEPLMRKSAS